jgi:hypothetical protein
VRSSSVYGDRNTLDYATRCRILESLPLPCRVTGQRPDCLVEREIDSPLRAHPLGAPAKPASCGAFRALSNPSHSISRVQIHLTTNNRKGATRTPFLLLAVATVCRVLVSTIFPVPGKYTGNFHLFPALASTVN